MYGSNFCSWTSSPRATRSRPIEAAAMPLPSDETTPPVMKMKRVSPGAIKLTPESSSDYDLDRSGPRGQSAPPSRRSAPKTPQRAGLDLAGPPHGDPSGSGLEQLAGVLLGGAVAL